MTVNVLAKYECGDCSALFNEQEAICEDWRDPAKSLICPKCYSYLAVPKNPKTRYVFAAAIVGLAIGVVLVFTNGYYRAPLYGLLFTAAPLYFWAYPNPFGPTKTNVISQTKYNK